MWPVLSCFSLCQGGYQSVSFAQEPAGEVVALQVRGASVVGGGVGGRLSSTSTGYLQLHGSMIISIAIASLFFG